jgi:hypothetical protein
MRQTFEIPRPRLPQPSLHLLLPPHLPPLKKAANGSLSRLKLLVLGFFISQSVIQTIFSNPSFLPVLPSLLYRIRPPTRRRKRPLMLTEARTSEAQTPLQLEEVEAAAEELNALLAEEATAEADRRLLSRLAALSNQAAALVVRAAPPQLQSKCHNQTSHKSALLLLLLDRAPFRRLPPPLRKRSTRFLP